MATQMAHCRKSANELRTRNEPGSSRPVADGQA
jgi:hypothetical protein